MLSNLQICYRDTKIYVHEGVWCYKNDNWQGFELLRHFPAAILKFMCMKEFDATKMTIDKGLNF